MVTLESYAHAIIQLSTDGVVSKDTIGLMKSVGVPVMAKRTGFLWDEKAYKSFESTMKVFGKAEEVDGGVKFDVEYLKAMSGFGPQFSQYMFWKEILKELNSSGGSFDASAFIKKLEDSCLGMFYDFSDNDSPCVSTMDKVDVKDEVVTTEDNKDSSKTVKKPSKSRLKKEGAVKNAGKNKE